MASSLGRVCRDDTKTNLVNRSTPCFCCDETFTNASSFELHKMMFHGRLDPIGGRSGGGGGGDGGKKKGKPNWHAPLTSAPTVTTPLEDLSSDDSSDDCNSDDYDSEDDYIINMMNLMALSRKPLTKCKKYRSEMNAAQKSRFPYSCSYCKESFTVKPEYLLHMVAIHRECGACTHNSQLDQTTGELWDHDHFKSSPSCLNSSEGKLCDGSGGGDVGKIKEGNEDVIHSDRFICAKCGQNPGCGFALDQHYATAHKRCRSCKLQFDKEDDLHQHFSSSKVHKGKYCHGCKMAFSSKGGFSDHCDMFHSSWTNDQARGFYNCDACSKVPSSFPTEDELDAHLQLKHVRCFPCKREFSEKKFLYGHLTASNKHKFCIRCDSDFMSFESLRSHDCPGKNWLKHLYVGGSMDDRPKGSECIWATMWEEKSGYAFKEPILAFGAIEESQNPTKEHIPATKKSGQVHNPVKESDADTGEYSKDEKDLSCCVCQKSFDTLEGRKWHEYDSHLWCAKCEKQLASRKAYNEHQMTAMEHSMCFECGDYFITPSKLAQHQKSTSHSLQSAPADTPSECTVKTKKFVCDDCDYNVVFKTEKELVNHLSTRH